MVRFTLRIPKELHKQLAVLAKRDERSLNAQILYILKTGAARQGVSDAGLPVELGSLEPTEKQEVGRDS